MTDPKRLSIIDAAKLPEYPIPAGERLDSHSFIAFQYNRWLNSAFRIKAPAEIRAYGFDLFCIAQNQDPVGTLPDDDEQLSAHLNLDLATWLEIRSRPISPLYKWVHCRVGSEIRLMHPVVTDTAQDAYTRKIDRAQANADGRRRKRMADLTDNIARLGHSAMSKDAILVNRIADWLDTNCTGSWTQKRILKALEADSNRF